MGILGDPQHSKDGEYFSSKYSLKYLEVFNYIYKLDQTLLKDILEVNNKIIDLY